MQKPLLGERLAVLVANGFCERDLTQIQKALVPLGAVTRIISMDQGLVNSWNDGSWGLNFAADAALSSALAADFSMLVIPGGQRSVEKLKLTAHTRRFIGGFVDPGKPVVALGDALELLIFSEKLGGRTVAGPANLQQAAEAAGAAWSAETFVADGNLMTGQTLENADASYIQAVADFLVYGATPEEVLNEAA